jgi:hypothetical protein
VEPANDGADGAPIVFRAVPGDSAVLDGAGTAIDYGGLFQIIGRAHIAVDGLHLRNAARAGYFIEDARDIRIERCTTHNTVSSGIGAWNCRRLLVADCDVALSCNDGDQECITVAGCDSFEVRDCHVHDGGPGNNGGEGIDAKDGSCNGRLAGNVVHDIVRLGIYVDAWDKHTHDIEVAGNVVSACADGFALASESGGVLENIRVVNNVAYGNRWRGFLIAAYGAPGAPHPMRNIALVNNTAVGNGVPDWGGGIAHDNPEATGVVIRNNLCSGNASFQILVVPAARDSAAVDHNLLDAFRGDPEEVRGLFAVEGDPLFAAPGANDFHLSAGSPAVDAGSSMGAPSEDFEGRPRPAGAGVDIGAFEFRGTDDAEAPASLRFSGRLSLGRNYPNPALRTTTLPFSLPETGRARLSIVDPLGREMACLVDADMPRGWSTARWDASRVPNGFYVAVLRCGGLHTVMPLIVNR